jgi:hypothetical protein
MNRLFLVVTGTTSRRSMVAAASKPEPEPPVGLVAGETYDGHVIMWRPEVRHGFVAPGRRAHNGVYFSRHDVGIDEEMIAVGVRVRFSFRYVTTDGKGRKRVDHMEIIDG